MSYILTALQKSEQERREKDQGARALVEQAGNVDIEVQVKRNHHLVAIIAILFVCLCALALVLWHQVREEKPATKIASQHDLAPASNQPSLSKLTNANLEQESAVERTQAVLPATPTIPAENGTDLFRSTKQSESSQTATQTKIEQTTTRESQLLTLPADTTATRSNIQALYETKTLDSTPSDLSTDSSSVQTPAQQALSLRAKEIQQEIAQPDVPSIYELPVALQNRLPKMVYSAHIYSSDADSGFAIINDRRRYRGDRITANLVVVSIENNGVILSFEGETFRLGAMKNWPLE